MYSVLTMTARWLVLFFVCKVTCRSVLPRVFISGLWRQNKIEGDTREMFNTMWMNKKPVKSKETEDLRQNKTIQGRGWELIQLSCAIAVHAASWPTDRFFFFVFREGGLEGKSSERRKGNMHKRGCQVNLSPSLRSGVEHTWAIRSCVLLGSVVKTKLDVAVSPVNPQVEKCRTKWNLLWRTGFVFCYPLYRGNSGGRGEGKGNDLLLVSTWCFSFVFLPLSSFHFP